MFIVTKGTKWCLLRTMKKGEWVYRWSKVSRTMWARKDDAFKALAFVGRLKGKRYVNGAKVRIYLEMPVETVERPARARRMPAHRRPTRRRRVVRRSASVLPSNWAGVQMTEPLRFNNAPIAYDIEYRGTFPLDAPQTASEGGQ